MASSENLATFEPWTFRIPFADSWFSDAIARDTEVLTRALQESFSGSSNLTINTSDSISPVINIIGSDSAAPTPTGSGLSGSDHESVPEPRRRSTTLVQSGKISKRKSRASKKSQTTFIMADPANFRQMVQQVTGAGFGNSSLSMAPILKPEPQRPVSRSMPDVSGVGCLPTLDTSALLLDQHNNTMHPQQQQRRVGPATESGPGMATIGSSPSALDRVIGRGDNHDGARYGGFSLDAFPSFPTLESWKVT